MQIRESNIRSNPKNAASLATRSQTVEIEEGGSAERKAAAAAKQEYGGGGLGGLGGLSGIGARNFNRRNTSASAFHSLPQKQDFKRSSHTMISKHVSIKNFVAKRQVLGSLEQFRETNDSHNSLKVVRGNLNRRDSDTSSVQFQGLGKSYKRRET